jgi:hypothetical protein
MRVSFRTMEFLALAVSCLLMDRDRERQELDAQLARYQARAKDYQDGQPPLAQNAVLVPKKVIAALQAAQLLPTD